MKTPYNKYYETRNLFGEPHLVLIDFFKSLAKNLKVLDIGAGQGRNAIPLAQLGFDVTALDISEKGLNQIREEAFRQGLEIHLIEGDLYNLKVQLDNFDIYLLDSMLHFYKKDRIKEEEMVMNLVNHLRNNAFMVFCLPHKPWTYLKQFLAGVRNLVLEKEAAFDYTFSSSDNSTSVTPYYFAAYQKKIHEANPQ